MTQNIHKKTLLKEFNIRITKNLKKTKPNKQTTHCLKQLKILLL